MSGAGGSVDPLQRFRVAAAERAAAGLRRGLRPRPAGGDGLVDLASNDYLGLSRDPRVVAGAVAAAREWGAGSTGSRLVTGSTALHAQLEEELADFTGAGAALVFSSGYLANLAAVAALTGPGTLVVSESANHASIVDGCRLGRARVAVTPHRDVAAVHSALSTRDESAAVVVTDSVFSVSGEVAPLAELHRVARAHGALLVVDEAHALGVVGRGGRGAVDAAGLAGEPDIVRTVTLSKSLGAQGGAVLAHPDVIAHLVDTARSFIFDTGLAPAAAGAALAALRVLRAEPHLPGHVRAIATRLVATAARHGLGPGVVAPRVCAGTDTTRVGTSTRGGSLGTAGRPWEAGRALGGTDTTCVDTSAPAGGAAGAAGRPWETGRPRVGTDTTCVDTSTRGGSPGAVGSPWESGGGVGTDTICASTDTRVEGDGAGRRGEGWPSAVVPVVVGAPERAVRAAALCAEHGVKVGCFRPPAVPPGRSCLRLAARADLTEAELSIVDGALADIALRVSL